VRTNTVIGPGGDAAVIRVRGTRKALALKTDCNGRYVYLDPRVGGRIAVAEAARNVACTGARPMAITNCLNFGNPRRPEVYYQLTEAIAGMGEACTALSTPVTGGNVSLYNESPSGAVYPTPVVGMVGLMSDVKHATRATFSTEGDAIVLFGRCTDELGGSEYLARIHGVVAGAPPRCDLAAERAAIEAVIESIEAGQVSSAHDCSDGGLAVALAECCIADRGRLSGADVVLDLPPYVFAQAGLFGEAQARFVISTADAEAVLAIARSHGVPARKIGIVTDKSRGFRIAAAGKTLVADVGALAEAYHGAIPAIMSRPALVQAAEPEPVLAGVCRCAESSVSMPIRTLLRYRISVCILSSTADRNRLAS